MRTVSLFGDNAANYGTFLIRCASRFFMPLRTTEEVAAAADAITATRGRAAFYRRRDIR